MHKDSCQNRAITMTMIHIAQSEPDQFYGSEVASLFKAELTNGNLDKDILIRSSIVAAKTMEFCNDSRLTINRALELWGLDNNIFEEAKFIDCNE